MHTSVLINKIENRETKRTRFEKKRQPKSCFDAFFLQTALSASFR